MNTPRLNVLTRRAYVYLSSTILTAIAALILHASGTPWHTASLGLLVTFFLVVTGFILSGTANRDPPQFHSHVSTSTPLKFRHAAYTWTWALLAYAIYATGVQLADLNDSPISLHGSAIFIGMITLPIVTALIARSSSRTAHPWWLLGIILMIWAPFDSGLLAPVWPWPQGGAAYTLNVWISCVLALSAMNIAGADRHFSTAGFRIMPSKNDLRATFRDQLWFTPAALVFGFLTGFFAWHPKSAPLWQYPVEALGLYLTVALPEELLFRGLMQPTLEAFSWPQSVNRKKVAKWLTAIIFGLSHINNDPVGDWRYVALATMAGIAYANVYEKTNRRSLAAPALLHTVVDWLWSNLFRAF